MINDEVDRQKKEQRESSIFQLSEGIGEPYSEADHSYAADKLRDDPGGSVGDHVYVK